MKIRIIAISVMTLLTVAVGAQKKELSQARTYLKSGKDFDKAEQLMTDLLKDPANRQNLKVYQLWYESVRAQYEAANEKLYLKQKYDTVQFFSLIRRLYLIGESLDSVDARPDHKGRVRPEYRRVHAEQLDALRRNLYYGGTYMVRKARYEEAYGFFETYLDTDKQPLFAGYDYLQNDSVMAHAAYWATYCGYQLQHPDSALRYQNLALCDSAKRDYVLQYVSEAFRLKHCDETYVTTLRQGFDEYPEHPYFFPRLVDWLTAKGQYREALQLAEYGLQCNSDNQLFLLGKAMALLNIGDDDGCMETSRRLIELNDSLPEPYFNIATVLLNRAWTVEQQNEPRKNRQKLQQIYAEALPYMEDYRRLAPADQRRWAPALYRIYLNLNMGRQFEEIDRVMREMEKTKI